MRCKRHRKDLKHCRPVSLIPTRDREFHTWIKWPEEILRKTSIPLFRTFTIRSRGGELGEENRRTEELWGIFGVQWRCGHASKFKRCTTTGLESNIGIHVNCSYDNDICCYKFYIFQGGVFRRTFQSDRFKTFKIIIIRIRILAFFSSFQLYF